MTKEGNKLHINILNIIMENLESQKHAEILR